MKLARRYANGGGSAVAVFGWVLLSAIPAIGLVILWIVLDRWGRKHDPMKRSKFDHLTPGSEGRRRTSLDD